MKTTKQIVIVISVIVAALALANVMQNARDQREKAQMDSLIAQVRLAEQPTTSPTPPSHDTMHVTVKVQYLNVHEILRILHLVGAADLQAPPPKVADGQSYHPRLRR